MEEQKLIKRKVKALKENNSINIISALLNLAEYYFKEGHYLEAIDEFKQVARKNKSLNNMIDYARCHRMIGEAFLNLREFEKALEHQQIHLQISKQEKNKLEEQRALATIGHIYLTSYLDGCNENDKTPLNLAYKSFMKSLSVCESLTDISKREHMDMTSRLFTNLGVVQESLGNFDKALELIMKSVSICKNYELHEQLQRSHCLLGSIYTKMGSFSNAIHQYNLAVEVAGRLTDKIQLICSALQSKSDLLIKLGDFHGAKSVLLKAYKLKNPVTSEKELIEHNLKTVTAMCYTEEKLLKIPETDFNTRKKLYEKIGDGASELRCFSKAIEYYEKMLDAAIKNGERDKDLSPAYVSLAQTYLDNKQYDLAIEYFEKDFNINQSNLKDSITTLFSIIDAMKGGGKNYKEIEEVFKKAQNLCKKFNDVHLEGKVLTRYKNFIEKNFISTNIDKIQKELNDLNYISSDEELDLPQTPTIGDEIDLENITDVSDDDSTQEKESRSLRKRTKTFTIKRNNKGETQLHTACISGNLILVNKLLNQGHAVNVRDNCGWLPIHEACINGHLEIVKVLIEKGANLNDRGGTLCNGITPLHDAALNGHLEIIELLLNKGANVVCKNDEGETPFHILKRWRENNELDFKENELFERIYKKMGEILEKCGQDKLIINKENNKNNDDFMEIDKSNEVVGKLRRINPIESSEDENSSSSTSSNHFFKSKQDSQKAKNEYKEVMESLRYRKKENKFSSNISVKRSALLSPEDVDDDWLEDDLTPNLNKKRKTNSLLTTTNIRKSKESFNKENQSFDVELSDSSSRSSDEFNFSKQNQKKITNKRKRQASLISSGFTRKLSDNLNSQNLNPSSSQKNTSIKKLQTKTRSFTENSNLTPEINFSNTSNKITPPKNSQNLNEQTIFVDIRILDKLYRVPVNYSEINTLTIQWLAEEASKRYSRKECMKPSLELQTKTGAILAEDDPINILFPMGSTQCEEIIGNVLKWNIQPIFERYKEACLSLGFNENADLSKTLRETSTILNLSNKNLQTDSITPLCKALNRQLTLVHLDLSGNYSIKEGLTSFISALPSLQNLSVLNLSNTDLDAESLGMLSQTFLQNQTILENLINLDLSHNLIGDEGLPHLGVITRNVKLQSLYLRDVDFTNKIFDNITNKCIELYLDFLEDFDISYNNLDKNDVMKFLSWVQPNRLKSLNISNNLIIEDGLLMEIVCLFQTYSNDIHLNRLNVSRCKITDSEIYELINVLEKQNMNELNLSYNNELTSISLRRLLQSDLKVKNIILIGCSNFKYFEHSFEVFNKNIKSVMLSIDAKEEVECNRLIEMWKKCHDLDEINSKVLREIPGLLELSVKR